MLDRESFFDGNERAAMKRNKNTQGFTLVELLVVVMIIAILGTVVGVQFAGKTYQAQKSAVIAQMGNFKTALQMYRLDAGQLPTQQQGLHALCERPVTRPLPVRYAKEGYLESRSVPLDPWNNEYVYLIPGREGEIYEILSYGKDGEPGGIDEDEDLSSSNR